MGRWRTTVIALLLAGATLALYWPVRQFEFVDYDDNILVTDNEVVRSGLNWASVRWAVTTPVVAIWHPVTTLSHMVDCQLFGLNAGSMHLVNAALHAANALLLFLALRRLTGATWRSAVVAGIFALHPLRVESVAWISERKDVLSGLFFMPTLWAWGSAVQSSKSRVSSSESRVSSPESEVQSPKFEVRSSIVTDRWYWLALVFFACGLMSKPMIVTLPFVLLLLDYWPLGRLRSAKGEGQRPNLMALIVEKLPFFALSAAFSLLTFYFQRTGTAIVSMERVNLADRLGNAVVSYLRYLGKFFWPTDLAAIHPHPSNPFPLADRWAGWQIWAGAAALAGITIWCFMRSGASLRVGGDKSETCRDGRNPEAGATLGYLVVGWLWFLGTLVPVIGLVQVGGQAMADRYTYIPLIGVAIALVWGVADWSPKFKVQSSKFKVQDSEFSVQCSKFKVRGAKTTLAAGFAVAGLVACAVVTRRQLEYWRNTISLFEHTIAVTADNPDAHFGLGIGLQKAGQPKRAMTEYRVALAINPELVEAQYNIGQLLREAGKLEDAARAYEAVLKTYPDHYFAHFNLAGVYWLLGRRPEAIAQMEAAIRSDPASADARNNLAWWLAAGSDANYRDGARAVQLAEQACEMTSYKKPLMIGTLAAAYAEAGRFDDAVAAAERAKAVAERAGDKAIALRNSELEELYRSRKAFHEE